MLAESAHSGKSFGQRAGAKQHFELVLLASKSGSFPPSTLPSESSGALVLSVH